MNQDAMRFRQDIEWVAYEDETRWVARDPMNGNFFYFNEVEYRAVKLLDGNRPAPEIILRLQEHSSANVVSLEWLQFLVLRLSNSLLMLPDHANTSVKNIHPTEGDRVHILRQILRNPLAIRVPILKPTGFSTSSRFLGMLLFHPLVAVALALAMLVCGFLVAYSVLSQPEQFVFDASKIQGDRWVAILLVYLVVKSLHEIGHVLACANWKVNCKEIGILFLFLAPCLYCDTTECWKLRSRWQRAAVAAGGIYVELILACVATLVWLNTREGLEHTLAASTMLMCSVGTILVNGNPFFKYDGYFIVSDLWGIPNLSQQASTAFRQIFVSFLGGRKQNQAEFEANIWALAAFATMSSLYRWSAIILLAWLIWTTLAPSGLGFIAILVLTSLTIGLVSSLYRAMTSLFLEFFASNPISIMRFLFFVVAILFVLFLGSTVPIPNYVRARGLLDFGDKSPIYASQTAAIRFVENRNERLKNEQLVIELDCPEKIVEFDKLQMEMDYLEAKLALLRKSSVDEPSAAYEVPLIIESLNELKSKRNLMLTEMQTLSVRAPMNGYFISSNIKVPQSIVSPKNQRLASHPTDASSLGCVVERGALLGWFSEKREVLFQTLVSETDIKSIRLGMRADCILDSHVNIPVQCKVSRISPDPVGELPFEFVGDPMFVAKRNEKGLLQPETPHYLVTVEAETGVPTKIKGAVSSIFFRLQSKTILQHCIYHFRTTFQSVKSFEW